MLKNSSLCTFALVASALLGGCGFTVPTIGEPWDRDIPPDENLIPYRLTATAQIEFEIKKRIYCDLKEAVDATQNIFYGQGSDVVTPVKGGFLPLDWGAETSLSLQVDEATTLNPGITSNDVMRSAINSFGPGNTVTTPQLFSIGFGANLSSTATRVDRFDSYYTIARLYEKRAPEIEVKSICNKDQPKNDPFVKAGYIPATSTPFVLESDLGIKDWLIGALYSTRAIPSNVMPGSSGSAPAKAAAPAAASANKGSGASGGKQQPDTVTIEIKFIIVSTGNVNPSWKLVRFTANTGSSPFFTMGRTRTHDLIITIGPPNSRTTSISQSQQIGNAVGNANRAALTTPSGF